MKIYISSSTVLYEKNLLKKSWFKTEVISPHESAAFYIEKGLYDIRIKTCDSLVDGRDYFLVPEEDTWSTNDDHLYEPVY